jgi:hypothetical protein
LPGSNAGFSYPVPFATDFPAAAAVGSTIYVAVANNASSPQFYQNSIQVAPPAVHQFAASAVVVNGVFYLIGGLQQSDGPGTGALESYQPCTDVNTVFICVGPQ